jgi:uncharacterized protein (UPF0333 family)
LAPVSEYSSEPFQESNLGKNHFLIISRVNRFLVGQLQVKNKKLVLLITLGIMVFSATGFEASIQTNKETAETDSSSKHTVNIHNNGTEDTKYSISLLSPKSSWFYYPNTVEVPANTNKSFQITVTPDENALQQRYNFETTLREQSTGKTKKLNGFFQVKQPYKIQIMDLKQNKNEFNPGEVIETEIGIRNLDNQQIENYQVKATYRNTTKTDTGTPILPSGERKYNFKFKTSKDAKPQTHKINYQINVNGKTERETSQNITINKVENISKSSQTDNKILTVTETRAAKNNGNSESETSITAQIPGYMSIITSTDPQPSQIQEVDGKKVYTWQKNLKPGQETTVKYTTNYWMPLLGLLILTSTIIVAKKIGTDVNITKKIETEGEKVKIRLEIQNTGEKTYKELQLEEYIPDIAEVDETFEMNTPDIQKTSQGTKLKWKITDLEPEDQRVIQYQIKPKIQVEDKVELKKAVIKDKNGQKKAESNNTTARFTPDTT